jgi:hypothetical protein
VFSGVFYFIEINEINKGQYNRGSYGLNIFFSYRRVFSNGEALTPNSMVSEPSGSLNRSTR